MGRQHGWTARGDEAKQAGRERPIAGDMIGGMPTSSSWLRLADVLRAHAPHPPRELRADMRLVDDLGFDSLALARAVVALETEFATELPQSRLHELRTATVGQLADMVSEGDAA